MRCCILLETSTLGGSVKQSKSGSSFRWKYAPSIGPDLLPSSVAAAGKLTYVITRYL